MHYANDQQNGRWKHSVQRIRLLGKTANFRSYCWTLRFMCLRQHFFYFFTNIWPFWTIKSYSINSTSIRLAALSWTGFQVTPPIDFKLFHTTDVNLNQKNNMWCSSRFDIRSDLWLVIRMACWPSAMFASWWIVDISMHGYTITRNV